MKITIEVESKTLEAIATLIDRVTVENVREILWDVDGDRELIQWRAVEGLGHLQTAFADAGVQTIEQKKTLGRMAREIAQRGGAS